MKAPIELYTASGEPAGVFCCGQCGVPHAGREDAAECCPDPVCADCGAELPEGQGYGRCVKCRCKRDRICREVSFREARKMEEGAWAGPVWHPILDYFESVAALRAELVANQLTTEDVPYCFTAEMIPVISFDYEQVIDQCSEEGAYAEEEFAGRAEFEAAITAFVEANADRCVYSTMAEFAVMLIPLEEVGNLWEFTGKAAR